MSKSQDIQTDPLRLSEEGGVFSALAELRGQGLSPERLARGGDALAQHVAGRASVAATTSASTGLAGKLGLGVLTLALLAGAWWTFRQEPDAAPSDMAPVLLVASVADAGVMDAGARAVIVDASSIDAQTREVPVVAQTIKANTNTRANGGPPASQLPAQLQLLKEAKALAQAGKHSLALERLTELSDRFPATPLQAEVDLRRAISLSGKGDLDRAGAAVRELLKDPRHSGRQAELHHMLVDIYVQRGECPGAQAALQAARAAGLDATSLVSAERGVLRCRPLIAPSEGK